MSPGGGGGFEGAEAFGCWEGGGGGGGDGEDPAFSLAGPGWGGEGEGWGGGGHFEMVFTLRKRLSSLFVGVGLEDGRIERGK